jgi:hypothetical protein
MSERLAARPTEPATVPNLPIVGTVRLTAPPPI